MAEIEKNQKNIKNTKNTSKNTKKVEKIDKNVEKKQKNIEKIAKIENNDNFFEIFKKDFFVETQRPLNDIIYANLIAMFAIFISAFIPILSLALPFLFMIYFEVGVFGFVYKVEDGKSYHYEEIFISLKKVIKVFCAYVIKMFLALFGAFFLIVPGVIILLQYAFCPIILFEGNDIDVRSALSLSKEMTNGHKWNIFFYSLLALASVCVAITFMFLIMLFFDAFFVVPPYFYVIFLTLAGILDFVLVAVPVVEIAVADSYISAKKNMIQKTL